jgi:hypothetical protein
MSKLKLRAMMKEPLPTISKQKRFHHRTTSEEVTALHKILNKLIFDNVLSTPEFEVMSNLPKYWGMCYGEWTQEDTVPMVRAIRVMDKWWSKQWLVIVLSHEMCHQYQWEILGPKRLAENKKALMSHGPSFYIFRDKFKEYGIPIKRQYSRKRWFKHQSISKMH